VRSWTEPAGQVFVDGALWRARQDWAPADEADLHEGDPVVVERVNGLTLSVRRAEDWELIA
jgi:membrane-bound serine protease (ClpP class)